jgi:NADP-dependent 3-hydroxy acid dehydrogenase YdfG
MGIRLAGKVVLITGASSGFGEASARLFAKEGCRVVLAARRLERLEALAAEIEVSGGEALPLPLDVTQQLQIDDLVRAVLKTYGRIDVLFNNAGFGRLDWLEQLDPKDDIDSQLDVNLRGVIQLTRAVLPHMLEQRRGQIINMSSVAGWIASPLYTIYAATKFGVRGFTDALRREVSPFGIHVSGIYPGPAKTEFGQHTGQVPARQSLRRFKGLAMTSEYVARCVVGLAKRPRRTLIIPWWYRLAIGIDRFVPGLVDWFLNAFFTHRFHKMEE